MQEKLEGRQDDGVFEPEPVDEEDLAPRPFTLPERRRALWVTGILLALILLAVLPPLINVNRFRRQIASSISLSLGRPVRIDSVTLDLLPMPGFTLSNFVVSEDPAFGAEPVIRASSVRARLRWRSLWRRRVEFSRISLTDPSVNLVHREDGRWNLESILLQASRMPAAPTGQRSAGDRPRFPYIEATGARVNLKMGLEKMPLSLTDAEFALWLPQAEQWHVRLEAHPTRTDTAATDTGTFRLEGTLGRAARLDEVPLDLQATWSGAPLGAASWVLMGRDAGFRGDLTLHAGVKGLVGHNALDARLHLAGMRRADFVPARTLDVDISCDTQAEELFHHLHGLRCSWPAGTSSAGLVITGDVPDSLHPASAQLQGAVRGVPAAGALDVLRLASERVNPALSLGGTLTGDAQCCTEGRVDAASLTIKQTRLALGAAKPFVEGDVLLRTERDRNELLTLLPAPVDLGGATTAMVEGSLGWTGYTVHVSGPVERERLLQLAGALPQFGDGLPEAVPEGSTHVDLTGVRAWSGVLTWSSSVPPAKAPPARRRRRP